MENWDEVIIKTDFMKGLISRLISKALKEKIGQINELDITDRNEKFRAHLNVDAEISMKELEEILKSIV